MNKTICVYPWEGAAYRPIGQVLPCCRYRLNEKLDIFKNGNDNNFRSGEEWQSLREKMLSGEEVTECEKCYTEEKSNLKSMRQMMTPADFVPTSSAPHKLKYLEMAFSNLCNLACVSCRKEYSTKWATEDYKHSRLIDIKPLINQKHDMDNIDVSDVKWLKIIGGEPFMEQAQFINLIKRTDISNLSLIVATNGTMLPNAELKSLMDKCKHVMIEVSIDGTNTVNEWYRWPTKFNDIEETFDQFKEWWGDQPKKYHIRAKHLINIYNIWNLDEFVIYMKSRHPNVNVSYDWIWGPAWQSLSIIPAQLKSNLIKKLEKCAETIDGNWDAHHENIFKVSIDRVMDNPSGSWQEFKTRTLNLSKERKLNVLEMVPHLKSILEELNEALE